MLLTLVDKLIDRCIDLVKHKQEVNRSLFSDFVEPAYIQFEIVHNDYLETFRSYRGKLKDGNESLAKLIDKIKEDNLFSENQRHKLYALAKPADPLVGKFVRGIYCYLTNPYTFAPGRHDVAFREDQRWRVSLLHCLEMIGDKDPDHVDAETAINNLDMIVEEMQTLYGRVTKEYLGLKKQLLA